MRLVKVAKKIMWCDYLVGNIIPMYSKEEWEKVTGSNMPSDPDLLTDFAGFDIRGIFISTDEISEPTPKEIDEYY